MAGADGSWRKEKNGLIRSTIYFFLPGIWPVPYWVSRNPLPESSRNTDQSSRRIDDQKRPSRSWRKLAEVDGIRRAMGESEKMAWSDLESASFFTESARVLMDSPQFPPLHHHPDIRASRDTARPMAESGGRWRKKTEPGGGGRDQKK